MSADSPVEIINGAAAAAKEYPDINIVLTGDKSLIDNTLSDINDLRNIKVVHAEEVITNNDTPTTAIKVKKNSSLVKALNMLKEDDDALGLISAGSTGAVLTGATLIIGRMEGVYRPTLISQLPTANGGFVCITDSGANMESHPEWLVQFAIMGSTYMRAVTGKANPSIALLNVGTEDHKGNTLTRTTYQLLTASKLNFVGNMEARDALTGNYDVVVCDGFDGNVLLKSSEGAVKLFMKKFKQSVMSSLSAKIGYLFMKKAFKQLRASMDYNNYGGGPFLGTKKPIIKAHGASNAMAIKQSVKQLLLIKEGKVLEMIRQGIAENETR